MDPTINLCRLYSSFSKSKPKYSKPKPVVTKNLKLVADIKVERLNLKTKKKLKSDSHIYVNKSTLDELAVVDFQNEDDFINEKFGILKKMGNPFERIKNSIFVNRSAVKLANLDCIFDLTKSNFGLLSSTPNQTKDPFLFCDVASAPGGFTQYIQYRKGQSLGYGLSLHPDDGGLHWREDVIEMDTIHRFNIEWGDQRFGGDGTGNLFTNSVPFSKKIKAFHPNGVDLVVGDGGYSVNEKLRKRGVDRETEMFQLILNEFLIALKTLNENGSFACKIFRTVKKPMVQLLYLLSTCFDEFYLIKPASSRPLSSEKFVVTKGLRKGIAPQIKILEDANEILNVDFFKGTKVKTYMVNLIKDEVPKNFVKYIEKTNNYTLSLTLKHAKRIGALGRIMKSGKRIPPEPLKYNLSRFPLVWDIPSYVV